MIMNRQIAATFRLALPVLSVMFALASCGSAYAQDQTTTPATPAAPAATPAPAAPAPTATPAPDTTAPVPPGPATGSNSPSSVQTTTSAAPPPVHHTGHFELGPQFGVYLPTSGKTRSRFGDAWYSVGIGLGSISVPHNGRLTLDLNAISQIRGDDAAYVIPLGIQYIQPLSQTGSSIPYAGISADLVFNYMSVPEDNIHYGLRETGGGSVFLGTTLGRNAYVEVRYLEMGTVRSYDFSGLSVSIGARF
jgi:hypothetical protein